MCFQISVVEASGALLYLPMNLLFTNEEANMETALKFSYMASIQDILRISSYSVRMRENTDQNNSE